MELTKEEQGILLLSARSSIRTLFEDIPLPRVDYKLYPRLGIKAGAFVTLHLDKQLRGCIGFITSDTPLFQTVCEAAVLAASKDYRFPPVYLQELSKILIEISVLTPPEKLVRYEDIVIGRHGLILEDPAGRGVLLPQVATEHNFGISDFLSALCRKAGLPNFEWRERFLNILTFRAIVFSETHHRNTTLGQH
ncbi:MAG: AmmeMemoRadiSam system protein A [Ignavibacteriales bacterium]|jgi:AmmeMemoRadiSam system protein A|nr:AmmeMemoRadiSam system protein A [Ignavibacteriaceae bacterium]NLH61761.1 AmmeMemoRadiSam system protein A [Ignavibacteriales bacterium]HOJ19668.1 AmmeMemoRadiSam system protein A [Ignavibacteriaceae bacterium]HPO56548.1 AmmeMemoRadiSam system protein A [Ignavibacteriaceae bacterium]